MLNKGIAVLTYLFRVLHRFCLVLTPKGWNFASAQTGWIYISYFGHPASRNVCKIKVLRSGVALKGLCQLESMRSEVMQITFNCQNSIVFNA